MPPVWLSVLAVLALALGAGYAAGIAYDIVWRGYRQKMPVMELVWPLTALYAGPAALWAYRRWGRPMSPRWCDEHGDAPSRPRWVTTAIGVSHCGGGCTLGDVIGSWLVFGFALEIAGRALWPEYLVDYALAVSLGIAFQYFAIVPMRKLGVGDGIVAAAKADILSLSAFEIGMFGWMAFVQLVVFRHHPLRPDQPVYWLSMQIGMLLGFATAFPANQWLITRGIKEAM